MQNTASSPSDTWSLLNKIKPPQNAGFSQFWSISDYTLQALQAIFKGVRELIIKIIFDITLNLITASYHNFAYVTAAQLSWHLQNCEMIWAFFMTSEQHVFYNVGSWSHKLFMECFSGLSRYLLTTRYMYWHFSTCRIFRPNSICSARAYDFTIHFRDVLFACQWVLHWFHSHDCETIPVAINSVVHVKERCLAPPAMWTSCKRSF